MRLFELTETRQAYLYHGTSMPRFIKIMNDQELYGWGDGDGASNGRTVRMSRSIEVAKRFTDDSNNPHGPIGAVLVFDQNKLRQRYKISPFRDPRLGNFKNDEMEEVVHTSFIPLSYMVGFYVSDIELDEVMDPEIVDDYLNSELSGFDQWQLEMSIKGIKLDPRRL